MVQRRCGFQPQIFFLSKFLVRANLCSCYLRLLNILNLNFLSLSMCGQICPHYVRGEVNFLLYIIMNMNINIGAWELLVATANEAKW